MSLQSTPSGDRLHIGFYGRRNSGKSSLINAYTGQQVAIVSDTAGTTTDPVYKAIEIHGIGPCILIDTAGLDDEGVLGELRTVRSRATIDRVDIAILLVSSTEDELEISIWDILKERNIPIIVVISKADILNEVEEIQSKWTKITGKFVPAISIHDEESMTNFRELLIKNVPKNEVDLTITENLVEDGDVVLLVMPQDIQAPKGRLILPQVQTIRDILDKSAIVVGATLDTYRQALYSLKEDPKLIIADSSVFSQVREHKPETSILTSFSILFAAYKGDIECYKEGAKAIDSLTEDSRVLIAECCTHAPAEEDIGRVKLPTMLRERIGEGLTVEVVSGSDYIGEDDRYDLIIQCGGCMFNRRHVISRIDRARLMGIPITNYGIAIAYIKGLEDVYM